MWTSDTPLGRTVTTVVAKARRGRRVLLVTTVVVAALAATSLGSASHSYDSIYPTANTPWNCASGGGTPNVEDRYCQTDDAALSFWIAGGASTSERGQIRSVLNHEYGDTVLNPVEVPNGSVVWQAPGTGETDLIMDEVEMDNYAGFVGAAGAGWCDDAIDAVDCDQHYAFLDNDITPLGSAVFTFAACHEIGHTVGLTHGQDASPAQPNGDVRFRCMITGSVQTYTGPGENNKHQINIVYG